MATKKPEKLHQYGWDKPPRFEHDCEDCVYLGRFRYSVSDQNGDSVDSCGGFYGYDHEKSGLLNDAKQLIEWDIKQKRQHICTYALMYSAIWA